MNLSKKLKKIGMKVLEKKYFMLLVVMLTLIFGVTNVSASSNTSYNSWAPYIHWRTGINDANFDSISNINDTTLYNRYLNIPLRVANYCGNFPGNNNGECPDIYNAPIQMVGVNNGTLAWSNPYKYYNTPIKYADMIFTKVSTSDKQTFSSTNNTLKNGYFNNNNDYNDYEQTHNQPIYYVDSTHSSYYKRFRIHSSIDATNIPRETTDITQPGFSNGNILMYKMSYMLGPSNGNFGDGTWSSPTPEYDPQSCDDCYSNLFELPYLDVKRNARMWLEDENNYNDYDYNNKSWYLQNNHFGSMFDNLTYTTQNNIPGCYDGELCANTNVFQGGNPMSVFLSTHGHTFYDKNTGSKYYKKTTLSNGLTGSNTVEWLPGDNVGTITLFKNNSQVGRLSTSTIVVAQPYNYVYNDNGTNYYATVWFLDFYFFGYIDAIYDFDEIGFNFFLENQLSTYGNLQQLDLIKPDSQLMIIGYGSISEQLSNDLHTGISNTISQIPIIGPIVAIILEILLFCFGFINSFIFLLNDLPAWFRGSLIVLFISIVVRIIYKIIRGG